jgi:hypothetical protein
VEVEPRRELLSEEGAVTEFREDAELDRARSVFEPQKPSPSCMIPSGVKAGGASSAVRRAVCRIHMLFVLVSVLR